MSAKPQFLGWIVMCRAGGRRDAVVGFYSLSRIAAQRFAMLKLNAVKPEDQGTVIRRRWPAVAKRNHLTTHRVYAL